MNTAQKCRRAGASAAAWAGLVATLAGCYCPPPAPGPYRGAAGTTVGRESALAADQAAALAPLTDLEQAACTEVATRQEFRDTLGQDRYAVLSQVPVYRRYGNSFPRTCQIEIFDYPKNLDLQATIELATARVIDSRQLKDLQPAVGGSEIVVARGIAESAAEGRGRLKLKGILTRPLEDLQVTAMVRTDGQRCRTHRCVEIDFYEKGPDAGNMQAAEPTGTQVTWRPIKHLGRVIVDLTQPAVVSLEVF
jgi:Cu2+-containing amine oxidase